MLIKDKFLYLSSKVDRQFYENLAVNNKFLYHLVKLGRLAFPPLPAHFRVPYNFPLILNRILGAYVSHFNILFQNMLSDIPLQNKGHVFLPLICRSVGLAVNQRSLLYKPFLSKSVCWSVYG